VKSFEKKLPSVFQYLHFQVTASFVPIIKLEVFKVVRILFEILQPVVTSSNMKVTIRNIYVLTGEKICVHFNALRT